MSTGLKIVSWINVVMGLLALIGEFADFDGYAITGGVLFLLNGTLALQYINKVNKREQEK